jgi:hypothetical protein
MKIDVLATLHLLLVVVGYLISVNIGVNVRNVGVFRRAGVGTAALGHERGGGLGCDSKQ